MVETLSTTCDWLQGQLTTVDGELQINYVHTSRYYAIWMGGLTRYWFGPGPLSTPRLIIN